VRGGRGRRETAGLSGTSTGLAEVSRGGLKAWSDPASLLALKKVEAQFFTGTMKGVGEVSNTRIDEEPPIFKVTRRKRKVLSDGGVPIRGKNEGEKMGKKKKVQRISNEASRAGYAKRPDGTPEVETLHNRRMDAPCLIRTTQINSAKQRGIRAVPRGSEASWP